MSWRGYLSLGPMQLSAWVQTVTFLFISFACSTALCSFSVRDRSVLFCPKVNSFSSKFSFLPAQCFAWRLICNCFIVGTDSEHVGREQLFAPRDPGPEASSISVLYYLISTVTNANLFPHMRSDINFMLFTYSCHKVKQFLLLSLMKLHYLNEMHFTDKEECHFHKWKHC